MEFPFENDNFEPEPRLRSNTWPMRQPDGYSKALEESPDGLTNVDLQAPSPTSSQPTKKSSHRKNAWGNLSYADLITHAITSAPDGRRTLADIYEWMVANVSYFRDKGDSNSSAGWKNSVRHNLSLHNRFVRVQNETPGKSSWWMINPDPKPGKTARKRTASMETAKSEKRKDRVKKKIEAIRNGLPVASSTLERSPKFDSTESFEMNPELDAQQFSEVSRAKPLLPIHNEIEMDVDWTKSTAAQFDNKAYASILMSDNIKSEIKTEADSYMDTLTEDPLHQREEQTPLPPFPTAYETNLNLLRDNYPQYVPFMQEDYKQLSTSTLSKIERISPPSSPMFPQLPSNIAESNPLLRERLLDTPSMSPHFTAMGQFMEVLNQNSFMDFQQNVASSQLDYENNGIKQELELEEHLEVQSNPNQPQKSNEMPATSAPLESLFINQYRNFVLT